MRTTDVKIQPVILSGGAGTRLWPLSRQLYPKQLLALLSADSLLQATARRVSDPARYRPALIVANEQHRFIIREQLSELPPRAIILESEGRNTAPAIALAALAAVEDDPDAVLLVLPSDHLIAKRDQFQAAVDQGLALALATAKLVAFGITPDRPETGYGYIEAGGPLDDHPGCFAIRRFVEKPDLATARAYLDQGGFSWNSGMFLFKAAEYLGELERHAPLVAAACRKAMAASRRDDIFLRPDPEAWRESPSISVDYALFEKTEHGAVIPADMGWSDIGSWQALWEVSAKDAAGNALIGDVVASDCHDSYFHSDGPMLALVGVDNLVVVATKDAVMVAAKDKSQDVKAIVDRLRSAGRIEHIEHVVVYRPWGSYQTTDRGDRFQTKRITVKPGAKLSLQKHHHRAEHWVVVQGTARVTRGEESFMLHENESCYIPPDMVHRLENPGKITLHLVEIQTGSYLGEDDILRLDDHYGRD